MATGHHTPSTHLEIYPLPNASHHMAHSRGTRELAFIGHGLARCFVRCALLAGLLHVSGWSHTLPLSWSILIIPPSQIVLQRLAFILPQHARRLIQSQWLGRVQRLYQIVLILLLVSAVVQVLGQVAPSDSAGHWFGSLLLSTWVD